MIRKCIMAVITSCIILLCETLPISCELSVETYNWNGFVYCVDEEIGLCILELPDSEEVHIPEYIDGMQVKQLGYLENKGFMTTEEHSIDGDQVKKLTIEHRPICYSVAFHNLEELTYIDILYYLSDVKAHTWKIYNNIRNGYFRCSPKVILRKGDKQINAETFNVAEILIPKYVEIIEAGVFSGVDNLVLKTSYTSKPEGWEDGWNGDCEVQWGVDCELKEGVDYYRPSSQAPAVCRL